MRRVLLLLPLALIGCRANRQASVSADGRVASTVDAGTYVSGRGKVAEGGSSLAWSPDGQTLAISTKKGTVLWPKGETIPEIEGPFAWSPDGKSLAGLHDERTEVKNLATGETRDSGLEFQGLPSTIRWTFDGKVLALQGSQIRVEGGPSLDRKTAHIEDAVATSKGEVVWIESNHESLNKASDAMSSPLVIGRWNPLSGLVATTPRGAFGGLLTAASPRRLSLPLMFSLAPDGERFAVGGIVLDAGTRTITRLKTLMDKQTSKAEQDELERLIKGSRTKAVVVRFDGSGPASTLWSAPFTFSGDDRGIEDLSWSPDGRWLAIARLDGTVRVAAGG